MNLDYQVLGRDPATGNIDVLLVAVRKDIINSYLAAIGEAGLVPTIMDVDYFAIENMFETNYSPDPGEVVALLNIGAGYSSLTILKGGRSSFTGDIAVGGEQFTDLLVQEFGMSRGASGRRQKFQAPWKGITRKILTGPCLSLPNSCLMRFSAP